MENTKFRKLKDYNPRNCPVTYCLNMIGNKWKLLIIHHLNIGYNRYSMLQRELPEISRQTLTNQLREMEADGIIERIIFPQIPPRVEYKITELGETLMPILKEMSVWGQKHMKVD